MKTITIYTNADCDSCHAAKEFFQEKSLEYIEYDISKDKEAKKAIMKKGYMSVPLIMIGDKVLVGFDRQEVESALGQS